MTETLAAPAAAPSTVIEFEFPQLEGKHSFDVATIPPEVRFDFLRGALRGYIVNRLNGVHTRHSKDEKVVAWAAYDAAIEADPLQTAVAKPEGDRPAEPDYADALSRAFADLTAGRVKRLGDGEPKRKAVDPLTKLVTEAVVREVFDSRKATDKSFTYVKAKSEVGSDGIKYLNDMIEAKVAQGADRAQLEKMRDTRYINPMKLALGITSSKAMSELPSIL